MITKSDAESSDSFLGSGGNRVLRDENDYDSYFEDTMKAGHYENRKESVDIMIRSSREIIEDLVGYGVEFTRDGEFAYTREGAHSRPSLSVPRRYYGKEITSKLLERVREKHNITIYEYTTMTDIIEENGSCAGITVKTKDGENAEIYAEYTILASGGIGGLYQHLRFPSDRRCARNCEKASDPSGTFGLCTDPSDNIVFRETGQTVFDLRIRPWRRRCSVQ